MASERVRFIHTSDWNLESPLGGTHIPETLRDEFVSAPFQAAERIINTALAESVDFLILAGDILDTQSATPYTLDFLIQQFTRLHDKKIGVY